MQTQTMYYVCPPRTAQALSRGSYARNITVWGVFATQAAASAYIARTNRRLCATIVAQ